MVSAKALSPAFAGAGCAVADAADRWLDPGLGEPLGVADAEILAAAIGVMDEATAARRPTRMERLFQRIQHEPGMCGA